MYLSHQLRDSLSLYCDPGHSPLRPRSQFSKISDIFNLISTDIMVAVLIKHCDHGSSPHKKYCNHGSSPHKNTVIMVAPRPRFVTEI